MTKGRIHSIETFGTVDGPGIRSVLFLQGCPLRCKYCHNRDTWDPKGGTEYTADELINNVSRYSSYWKASGGGITASGGEATLQLDFLLELFKKAKEKNILLEVNNSSLSPNTSREGARENILKYLELCKEYGVRIIMGTDSHICYDIGVFQYAEAIIEEANFPKELVINYWEDQIIEFFGI